MVTLGSACTGWCSEVQACELLNVKYVHKFACDINPQVRKLNEENVDVQRMHHDVFSKEFSKEATVDNFSAGFPCQPYSTMGANAGIADPRADAVKPILKYINGAKPKTFFLEHDAA